MSKLAVAFFSAGIVAAVSYTHLDVYKRQAYIIAITVLASTISPDRTF